jgi:predicted Rossmann fold flavoprotein
LFSAEQAALLQAKINNVEIKEDCLVNEISKNNNTFCIKTNKGTIIVDKVILATGSLAYYKDEHSNIGYEIAKKFGHTIIKVLPSLVQLKGEEKYFKDWMGIRNNVEISLYEETKFVKKEEGEILLTDYGISGICVFNISGEAAKLLDKKKNVKVKINFVPWIKEDLIEWMNKRNFIVQERKIDELLEGFLNYKLVHVLLKIANIDKNKKWSNLTIKEQNELIEKLQNFTLNITGTNSFDKAQICSGGIDTQEINPKTMESLIVKGLYFAGEIIDVDGDCGGYNLSFAWQSGMIAGRSAGDDVD